jgi:hypothetical protein
VEVLWNALEVHVGHDAPVPLAARVRSIGTTHQASLWLILRRISKSLTCHKPDASSHPLHLSLTPAEFFTTFSLCLFLRPIVVVATTFLSLGKQRFDLDN